MIERERGRERKIQDGELEREKDFRWIINERERRKEERQMRKSWRGRQIERYIDRKSQREKKEKGVNA